MVQASALVMQLVFEHALRIRVKAETADKDATSKTSSDKAGANLLGKINNLLTVDQNNIGEARNVLFIVILVPIQVIGSIVFLYQVLGWRFVSFRGLALSDLDCLNQCVRGDGVRSLFKY